MNNRRADDRCVGDDDQPLVAGLFSGEPGRDALHESAKSIRRHAVPRTDRAAKRPRLPAPARLSRRSCDPASVRSRIRAASVAHRRLTASLRRSVASAVPGWSSTARRAADVRQAPRRPSTRARRAVRRREIWTCGQRPSMRGRSERGARSSRGAARHAASRPSLSARAVMPPNSRPNVAHMMNCAPTDAMRNFHSTAAGNAAGTSSIEGSANAASVTRTM